MANASKIVFVDTSAWIALTDKSDKYHPQSVTIYNSIKEQKLLLLTTDYVVSETATRIRYDADHASAVQFLQMVHQAYRQQSLNLVNIDATFYKMAVDLFRQYDDVALSFVDCASFAVCRALKLSKAFSFDQHFAMMGLSILKAD